MSSVSKFGISFLGLFMFMLFCFNCIVHAGVDEGGTYEDLKEGETIKVESNGTIYVTNYDKEASKGSTTTYSTLGYTVKRENKKIQSTESFIVPLEVVGYKRNKDDPTIKKGYIVTVQKIDSKKLFEQMEIKSSKWKETIYNSGGTVYLDGVMTINYKKVPQGSIVPSGNTYTTKGRTFNTAATIKAAADWGDKSALDTHFNKEVYIKAVNPNNGRIEADLKVTAEPRIIEDGVVTSVELTLDASESKAWFKEKDKEEEEVPISRWRFWLGAGDGSDSPYAGSEDTVTITVPDCTSGTVILCNVRVFSQTLSDKSIPAVDEKQVVVYLGVQGVSNAKGKLYAEERGNEKFDVLKGIPTTESLYANVEAEEYLVNFATINRNGNREYPVNVSKTYTLIWEEDQGGYDENGRWVSNWVTLSETQTVTNTYEVKRPYNYHVIDILEVYGISKAEIKNACLPSGIVTLTPKNYNMPEVDLWHDNGEDEHLIDPDYQDVTLPGQTLNGGRSGRPSIPTEDWTSAAEEAVDKIKVRNDKIIINDDVILDGEWYESDTPDPVEYPNIKLTDIDVLYEDNLVIEAEVLNANYKSEGLIYYEIVESVNSDETERIEKFEVNPVIVHTPVVCDPEIESDTEYNQEINPDDTRAALILGRSSTLTFSTIGNYINKDGYMNADYRKYTLDRIVKFPFDVYIEDSFLKADTEFHLPEEEDEFNIKIPIWVDEGDYDVECRAIAINSPGNDSLQEELSNISYENYIATKNIPVRVIGRLYGFKITDINDYPDWAEVFRTGTNSTKHSDNNYWVGRFDQDRQERGNSEKYTLPILNGSHSTKKNLGVLKTGYKFKFELNTIGNYFNDTDVIRIKPRFYYVSKDGKARIEVDLWYQEKINGVATLAKVGSKLDSNNIKTIVLGDPLRNVPEQELTDTSRMLGISKSEFANQKAKIGSYGDVILTKNVRTTV